MIGNKFITAAVSAALFTGSDGRPVSEVSQFANYFDYLNLMTVTRFLFVFLGRMLIQVLS